MLLSLSICPKWSQYVSSIVVCGILETQNFGWDVKKFENPWYNQLKSLIILPNLNVIDVFYFCNLSL
jgi:hypothetical protein